MKKFNKNKKFRAVFDILASLVLISTMLLSNGSTFAQSAIHENVTGGPSKTPDIVIINMDDMGYGDLDSYGAIEYKTPNLDKLEDRGMRFTNFYAAQPICTSSRVGLLTGTYPNRIGLGGMALFPNSETGNEIFSKNFKGPHNGLGINKEDETIGGMLQKKGYVTGIIGKWGLGDNYKFLPLQHGFDYYYGIPYSNDMWPVNFDGTPITDPNNPKSKFPPLPIIEGNKIVRHVTNLQQMGMVTTWYTQKAINFINKNKDKPFLLYFAQTMVHVPIAVSPEFKGKSHQGLYGDVMMYIDWSVGQVIKTLKEDGLANNTLVIFTSDNGPWLNFGNHAGSAGGLREGKGVTFDGGMKEPTIFVWPGVIQDGSICNKLASNIDILPTLAAITGAPLPKLRIDGVNILPLLKGESNANPRHVLYYYFHRDDLMAVREGQWKLIFPHKYRSYEGVLPGENGFPGKYNSKTTGLALYNLRRDPGERYDVKALYPDIVKKLESIGNKAREDLGDDLTGVKGENRRSPGRIIRSK